jgi:hypothetical protein
LQATRRGGTKAPLANAPTKALSKSFQSQPRKKNLHDYMSLSDSESKLFLVLFTMKNNI